jgi:hypothetical protein
VAFSAISDVQDTFGRYPSWNPSSSTTGEILPFPCLFHWPGRSGLRVYEGKYHGDAALQLFVSHHAGCDKGYENAVLKSRSWRANGYFKTAATTTIHASPCIADEDER